jgi:hypothetical protein
MALAALDRQHKWAFVGVTAAIISPTINLALIPASAALLDNGAIGAATTTVLIEYFMLASALYLLPRGFIARPQIMVAARCVLAAAIMAASLWLIRGAGIFVAVPIAASVYVAFSLALKTVQIDDALQLLSYVRKRPDNPGRQNTPVLTEA